MSAGARLLAFAAAVLAVGAIAAAVGLAVPAVHHDGDDDGHGHGPADGHGDHPAHGDPGDPGAAAAGPGGLAATDGRLTLRLLDARRAAPGAGTLRFRILDPGGRPVTDMDVAHERRMHLIVASRDLAHFRHVHPVAGADGTWVADLDLPAAGAYRAFADFSHAGLPRTLGADLLVDGPLRARALPEPSDTATGAGGYAAEVVERTARDGETRLAYRVTRAGRPVSGITPYLGAAAHVVALREGDLAFIHAHADDPAADGLLRAAVHAGPGRYRVFIEFRHAGAVRTVAHTLEVRR